MSNVNEEEEENPNWDSNDWHFSRRRCHQSWTFDMIIIWLLLICLVITTLSQKLCKLTLAVFVEFFISFFSLHLTSAYLIISYSQVNQLNAKHLDRNQKKRKTGKWTSNENETAFELLRILYRYRWEIRWMSHATTKYNAAYSYIWQHDYTHNALYGRAMTFL